MKKLLVTGLLLFHTLLFSETALTNKIDYVTYEDALNIANKDNKTIMIKMTSEHCRYCQRMDKKVMVEKEVISALKKDFVSVEIDVDNDEIPLELNRTMTPTFIFLNKKEEIINQIAGSWDKEDFLDILNSAIKKSKGESKWKNYWFCYL